MAGVPEPKVLKVLVLGESSVGKTAFIKRYVKDEFSENYKMTGDVVYQLKKLTKDGGQRVRVQLWDIPGEATTSGAPMAKVYYKDAMGIILLYDVTRPTTFDTVEKWKTEIDTKVTLSNGDKLPAVLVGMKSDMETADVDGHFMDGYCAEHNFTGWFDVSAKTGENVEESASALVDKILDYKDSSGNPVDLFAEKAAEQVAFKPSHLAERVAEPDEAAEGGGCAIQ